MGSRALAVAGMLAAFAFGCVSAGAGQPHMQAALEHLRAARAELVQAAPRKGGHRGRAVELVERAIAQVERGIAFDAAH